MFHVVFAHISFTLIQQRTRIVFLESSDISLDLLICFEFSLFERLLLFVERKRDPGVKEPLKPARERRENPPEVTNVVAGSKTKKPMKSLSSRFGEYSATPVKKRKEGRDEIITISVPVGETTKHRKVPTKEKPPVPKGKSPWDLFNKTVLIEATKCFDTNCSRYLIMISIEELGCAN